MFYAPIYEGSSPEEAAPVGLFCFFPGQGFPLLLVHVMNLVIEIRLDQYDSLMKRWDPAWEGDSILKSGVIFRRPKKDRYERIVEIRCSSEEAIVLLSTARKMCSATVSEIEKAFASQRFPLSGV